MSLTKQQSEDLLFLLDAIDAADKKYLAALVEHCRQGHWNSTGKILVKIWDEYHNLCDERRTG